MNLRPLWHALLAFVASASPALLAANPYPLGVAPHGFNLAAAADAMGNVVLAWESEIPFQGWRLEAQVRGLDRQARTAVVEVTPHFQAGGSEVMVGMDGAGNFAVAWPNVIGPGPNELRVRCFAADGTPRSGEVVVAGPNLAYGSQMAMNRAGELVLAWSEFVPGGQVLRARRLGADCTLRGPQVEVVAMQDGVDLVTLAGITLDPQGRYAVVYRHITLGNQYLQFQRFLSSGEHTGTPTVIGADRSITSWTVAMNGTGDFVVAWNGQKARRYDATGRARDARPFDLIARNSDLSLGLDDDGDMVLAWAADLVYVQRYASAHLGPTGAPMPRGTPFSQGLSSREGHTPRVAMGGAGDFTVAWLNGVDGPVRTKDVWANSYPQQPHYKFKVTATGGRYDSTPVDGGPAGTYSFDAKLCNKSPTVLSGLTTRTAVLTNGNNLVTRSRNGPDAGQPGGPGSSRDLPKVGEYVGGLLAYRRCVIVPYVIGLYDRSAFSFAIDILGDDGSYPTGLVEQQSVAPSYPLGPITWP